MRRKQKAVDNRTQDKEGLKRWYERKVVQSEQKRDRLIAEQEKLLGCSDFIRPDVPVLCCVTEGHF
jgi:hypothetical protein